MAIVIASALGIYFSIVWYDNFLIEQTVNGWSLSYMHWFENPDVYPDSFLLKQLFPHLYSAYYWLVGIVGLFFNHYWGLYGTFVIANCLLCISIYYLAYAITESRAASYLSILVILYQFQAGHTLGGAPAFGFNSYEPLYTALLLFAMACFLKKQYKAAFVLVGIAFNFHGSFAVFTMVMFFVALVWGGRKNLKVIIQSGVIALLCSSPLLIYMFLNPMPEVGVLSFFDWVMLVKSRSAAHAMPFHWSLGQWIRFVPYPLLFIVAMGGIRRRGDNVVVRDIICFAIAVFIMCVIGTIFSEVIPNETVIKLTLFRSTRLFVMLTLIIFSRYVISGINNGDVAKRIICCAMLAGVLSASIPVVYAILPFVSYAEYSKRHKVIVISAIAISAIMAGVAVRFYDISIIYYRANIDVLMQCGLVIAAAYVVSAMISRARRYIAIAIAILVLLLAGVPLNAYDYYRYFHSNEYYAAIRDLQNWMKKETEQGSMFLLPPDSQTWSGLSTRGQYMSYDMVGYGIYCKYLGNAIMTRLNEYGVKMDRVIEPKALKSLMLDIYSKWDEKRVLELSDKWSVDYIVRTNGNGLNLPLLYSNKYYTIYSTKRRCNDSHMGCLTNSNSKK